MGVDRLRDLHRGASTSLLPSAPSRTPGVLCGRVGRTQRTRNEACGGGGVMQCQHHAAAAGWGCDAVPTPRRTPPAEPRGRSEGGCRVCVKRQGVMETVRGVGTAVRDRRIGSTWVIGDVLWGVGATCTGNSARSTWGCRHAAWPFRWQSWARTRPLPPASQVEPRAAQ